MLGPFMLAQLPQKNNGAWPRVFVNFRQNTTARQRLRQPFPTPLQRLDRTYSTSGFRALLMSFAISGILPSVEKYGMLATNAGAAAMAWVGFLYVSLPDYESRITDAIRVRVRVGVFQAHCWYYTLRRADARGG